MFIALVRIDLNTRSVASYSAGARKTTGYRVKNVVNWVGTPLGPAAATAA